MSGYGLMKVHHGIMKSDALMDYNAVKAIAIEKSIDVVEPKGKHWHKIEDATAEMLHKIPVDTSIKLNRGIEYYLTLKDY